MSLQQIQGLFFLFGILILPFVTLFVYIFSSLGYRKMFIKGGLKGWYGFVPVFREYQLAVLAEHEEEGRTYCILVGCELVAQMLAGTMNGSTNLAVLLNGIWYAFRLAVVIYSIRIYLPLCRVFAKSRLWVILWVLIKPVPAMIWGYDKKTLPVKQLSTIDFSNAASISGASLEALQKGLTLNLKERKVMEFFRIKTLLRDIHFSIPAGHMVLLLGGSGAGKTTLLNAITGYEKADAEVVINGNDLYKNYDSMKYKLGFVPQQDLMRMTDTVSSTVWDAAGIRLPRTMSLLERIRRSDEVLKKFGLYSVRFNQVGKLSGGQRKRLSIAMEFISDPTLFILDEPDSGLDGVVARNLFKSLREIADEGKIVIVITHTPDRVMELFDDVIVLAKDAGRTGRLAYYGPIRQALTFFGKESMEDILLSVNQKDEGGEGRADEFVERYGKEYLGQAG